jgi:L-lactate utilization protein LutB
MKTWDQVADDTVIETTVAALAKNGITAYVAENGQQAKEKALEIIPQGAQVMTMTSMTLEALGIVKEINESGITQCEPSLQRWIGTSLKMR